MRRIALLVVIAALALTACNTETATPVLPTLDTSLGVQITAPVVPTETPLPPLPAATIAQRAFSTDEAQAEPLPIPGTLTVLVTEDPEAALVFDLILLERTGGITGEALTVDIRPDGTLTVNGVAGRITPEQVTMLDTTLDQLNFFGIQGAFTAPGTSADVYSYRITVDRAGSSKTIPAQDGFMPPQLQGLVTLILQVANVQQ